MGNSKIKGVRNIMILQLRNRWVPLQRKSPSGKILYCCLCCGRISPTPDKTCETIADPNETWGCSSWFEQFSPSVHRKVDISNVPLINKFLDELDKEKS